MYDLLGATVAAFGIVFIAELGDKTQLLAVSFGSRYSLRQVIAGLALGYGAASLVAVTVGGLLGASLPQRPIEIGGGDRHDWSRNLRCRNGRQDPDRNGHAGRAIESDRHLDRVDGWRGGEWHDRRVGRIDGRRSDPGNSDEMGVGVAVYGVWYRHARWLALTAADSPAHLRRPPPERSWVSRPISYDDHRQRVIAGDRWSLQ